MRRKGRESGLATVATQYLWANEGHGHVQAKWRFLRRSLVSKESVHFVMSHTSNVRNLEVFSAVLFSLLAFGLPGMPQGPLIPRKILVAPRNGKIAPKINYTYPEAPHEKRLRILLDFGK